MLIAQAMAEVTVNAITICACLTGWKNLWMDLFKEAANQASALLFWVLDENAVQNIITLT